MTRSTGDSPGVALVVGESLIDIVERSDEHREYAGGSAANVAVALARLARPTWFGTAYADDDRGRVIATHLDASGVRLAGDPHVIGRTSTALARIDGDGAATYEFDLDWQLGVVELPDDLPPIVMHVCSIGAVLEPGCEDVRRCVERYRDLATVVYDINTRPSITGTGPEIVERVERLAAWADIVKASDEDIAQLWPGRSLEDAADALLRAGALAVVVTRGEHGSVWFGRSGTITSRLDPVEVADTIGAGDTFSAGMIDALWAKGLLGAPRRHALETLHEQGWDVVLTHAARAAAVTVSRPGADPPWRHELA